jgi:hypothetical protein
MTNSQNVLFLGGSRHARIEKIPSIFIYAGFIDLHIYRTSDEFVDYIIASEIEPEKPERYIIKFIDDYGIYIALEQNEFNKIENLGSKINDELHKLSNSVLNLKKPGISK